MQSKRIPCGYRLTVSTMHSVRLEPEYSEHTVRVCMLQCVWCLVFVRNGTRTVAGRRDVETKEPVWPAMMPSTTLVEAWAL